jgi:hypothetical protein
LIQEYFKTKDKQLVNLIDAFFYVYLKEMLNSSFINYCEIELIDNGVVNFLKINHIPSLQIRYTDNLISQAILEDSYFKDHDKSLFLMHNIKESDVVFVLKSILDYSNLFYWENESFGLNPLHSTTCCLIFNRNDKANVLVEDKIASKRLERLYNESFDD